MYLYTRLYTLHRCDILHRFHTEMYCADMCERERKREIGGREEKIYMYKHISIYIFTYFRNRLLIIYNIYYRHVHIRIMYSKLLYYVNHVCTNLPDCENDMNHFAEVPGKYVQHAHICAILQFCDLHSI